MGHPAPGTAAATYTPPAPVTQTNETAAAALGARARADIEARTVVAMNRPRYIDQFREKLLEACKRTGFAEQARYSKPLGGGKSAEGFTIRFAEECVRHYRNLDLSTMVVSEDDERRVVRCSVTDLETNVPWSTEVVVPKTVERRNTTGDDEVLRKRTNSTGQTVYIRRATEDEIAISQNRLCAKAMRNLVLNHIPSDILEEADIAVLETVKAEENSDPTARRKKMLDAFYRIGVSSEMIAEFLEHPSDKATPAEIHILGKVYNAMKEGTTWAEVMESKKGPKAEAAPAPKQANPLDAAIAKQGGPKTTEAVVIPEAPAPAAAPKPLELPRWAVRALAAKKEGKTLGPDVLDDLRQLREEGPETAALMDALLATGEG